MATTEDEVEQRPQVLIVDDVPENIEVLAAALEAFP
jgi:CheY-like chemotaxis protein